MGSGDETKEIPFQYKYIKRRIEVFVNIGPAQTSMEVKDFTFGFSVANAITQVAEKLKETLALVT